MTLEIIQAKRAALLAECERAKGAIQALDDLISEVAADRERAKARAAEVMSPARAYRPNPTPRSTHGCKHAGGFVDSGCCANCDCHVTQRLVPLASESPPMSPPSPPEMFGCDAEEFVPCKDCRGYCESESRCLDEQPSPVRFVK